MGQRRIVLLCHDKKRTIFFFLNEDPVHRTRRDGATHGREYEGHVVSGTRHFRRTNAIDCDDGDTRLPCWWVPGGCVWSQNSRGG